SKLRCSLHFRSKNDLSESTSVAKVNKNKLAVITTSMHPPKEFDLFAVLFYDVCDVGSHGFEYANINIMLTIQQMFVRLVISLALGALLGLERELVGKEAGIRTEIIVAGGSTLFTITALMLPYVLAAQLGASSLEDIIAHNSGFLTIIANIVVGIGFLG